MLFSSQLWFGYWHGDILKCFLRQPRVKREATTTKKSTKSSEQGSFQKSLHEGIHFRQCPKSQESGTTERSKYFLRKVIGENGKLTLTFLLWILQWLLAMFWWIQSPDNSESAHESPLLRKLSGYPHPNKTSQGFFVFFMQWHPSWWILGLIQHLASTIRLPGIKTLIPLLIIWLSANFLISTNVWFRYIIKFTYSYTVCLSVEWE